MCTGTRMCTYQVSKKIERKDKHVLYLVKIDFGTRTSRIRVC